MNTAIGRGLSSSPSRLATAVVVAFLVVAADFALIRWAPLDVFLEGRSVLTLIALAVILHLVQGDVTSVGLVSPMQGWWYWCRAAFLIGLAVAACLVVGLGAWVGSGHELPIYATDPGDLGMTFLHMCVFAPVLEETIYRLIVCVPFRAWGGPRTAIAVSGLLFGVLHVVYGNPSPENLVAGFFLAWAYLKSESILVPVLLHALGNLCALIGRVGTWYWLGAGR